MEKSIHSAEYDVFLRTFREMRERAGLTQVDLARLIGETQSFVSKCERGERRIDVVELRTFCEAIGMPLKEFVEELEGSLQSRSRRRLSRR